MQKENTEGNNHQTSNATDRADISRMAAQFNVSSGDVENRLAMVETQKEMTRAYINQKRALRN